MRLFLDYNATTPVDARVLSAMQGSFCEAYGSASSRDHAFGWDAAESVEDARAHVADLIHAKSSEIVFTSGATESINLALRGIANRRKWPRPAIVTCATEHDAVLATARQLQSSSGVEVEYLAVDRFGHIDHQALENHLAKMPTALVAVMLANNEIGTIHVARKVSETVHKHGGLFFCDMTQAVGKVPVDVESEGIDLAAFSAHKIYGPKGVGALYMRGGVGEIEVEPLICGGGQERGLRGGTLNVPGIVGFGEASRIAVLEMEEETIRVRGLRDMLEETILSEVPGAWINGDTANRIGNTTNIGFRGVEAKALIRDMHNIAVSTQAACSSGSTGPSHVLKAIGLTDDEAYSCIRFSLGRFTTEQEIKYTVRKVVASVQKLRRALSVASWPGRFSL